MAVSQQAGFAVFEVYAYESAGMIYVQVGDPAAALPCLTQALTLSNAQASRVTKVLILLDGARAPARRDPDGHDHARTGRRGGDCAHKAQDPAARILVLTSFGEREKVAAAFRAGAAGYLLKDSSPDELFAAIHSVHRGSLVIPQELAKELLQPPPSALTASQFTARELDVLRLLVQGKSNPEIGQELFISATTVRSHVTSILTKLNVANRTQAALVAQERQLV